MGQIGLRLKRLREGAKLTQQELAVKAGISVSNLSQLEQGQKEDPRISTMVALARALGCSLDDMVEPVDDEEEKRGPGRPPKEQGESVPKGRKKR